MNCITPLLPALAPVVTPYAHNIVAARMVMDCTALKIER